MPGVDADLQSARREPEDDEEMPLRLPPDRQTLLTSPVEAASAEVVVPSDVGNPRGSQGLAYLGWGGDGSLAVPMDSQAEGEEWIVPLGQPEPPTEETPEEQEAIEMREPQAAPEHPEKEAMEPEKDETTEPQAALEHPDQEAEEHSAEAPAGGEHPSSEVPMEAQSEAEKDEWVIPPSAIGPVSGEEPEEECIDDTLQLILEISESEKPGEDGAKRHVFQDSEDKEVPETPETPPALAARAVEEGQEAEARRGCATGFVETPRRRTPVRFSGESSERLKLQHRDLIIQMVVSQNKRRSHAKLVSEDPWLISRRRAEVVVAVERDSAMAPKKVDYAVLPSSVWLPSRAGIRPGLETGWQRTAGWWLKARTPRHFIDLDLPTTSMAMAAMDLQLDKEDFLPRGWSMKHGHRKRLALARDDAQRCWGRSIVKRSVHAGSRKWEKCEEKNKSHKQRELCWHEMRYEADEMMNMEEEDELCYSECEDELLTPWADAWEDDSSETASTAASTVEVRKVEQRKGKAAAWNLAVQQAAMNAKQFQAARAERRSAAAREAAAVRTARAQLDPEVHTDDDRPVLGPSLANIALDAAVRLMSSPQEKQAEQLCPVLHGTEDRNLPSIYQKGWEMATDDMGFGRWVAAFARGKGMVEPVCSTRRWSGRPVHEIHDIYGQQGS
eukprot:Skav229123  [mRNA]  locus=scaffold2966:41791:54951:+ [translate_table: standard]